MGYLADESGRWMKRWAEIHRIAVIDRAGVSTREFSAVLDMEAHIVRALTTFFLESADGKAYRELMGQVAAGMRAGRERTWGLQYCSTFLEFARPLLNVSTGPAPARAIASTSDAQFRHRCTACLGSGVPILNRPVETSSREALQQVCDPFRVAATLEGAEWRTRLESANQHLGTILDRDRGRGAFDEMLRLIDDTIFAMPAKHIIDYHIWMHARESSEGMVVAVSNLGELTPRASITVEVGGRKTEYDSHWSAAAAGAKVPNWESPLLVPCPDCQGDGSRHT